MIFLLTALFTFLPIYLIRFHIGPLPTTALEILIWVIGLIWLTKKIKTKQLWPVLRARIIVSPGLFFFLFIFLLGATFGALFSPNLRAALGEWRAFYIEPALIFYIVIDTIKNKSDRDKLLVGLMICGLATAVLAIYQHFTGWLVPYSFWANRNTYRVTAWYGFPNGVGLFLAPIIPLAFYLLVSYFKKNKTVAILCGVYILTALLAIIFAKSTGALIGLTAGLGLFLLLTKKTRTISLVLGAIVIIGFIFVPANNAIKQEILAQDYSGHLRRDIWRETITYLTLHPLRGTGMAAYSTEIAPFRHNKKIEVFHHPHNIFLTIWVNTGLVGLVGFVGILVWFFWTSTRLKNSRFALISMTVILAMGLVDSPYIKNDLALLFWLVMALGYREFMTEWYTKKVNEQTI